VIPPRVVEPERPRRDLARELQEASDALIASWDAERQQEKQAETEQLSLLDETRLAA
jgi:hypothetical protein